jgi:hypothetical protein
MEKESVQGTAMEQCSKGASLLTYEDMTKQSMETRRDSPGLIGEFGS